MLTHRDPSLTLRITIKEEAPQPPSEKGEYIGLRPRIIVPHRAIASFPLA
jgi:hypothetical protein